MKSLRHLLPSANALIAFEAAARLQSFTRAGAELGLSQAAVSYAIKGLEGQLGVQLFRREHRQVRLTEAGERFFADVAVGLSYIRKSAEEIQARSSETHVTLAGSTAFASYWMMPRLQAFRDAHPGIDLRIQTAERDVDIASEGIPLGIRGGRASDWPGYDSFRLASEEITPVASDTYRRTHGFPAVDEDLADHRLIHLDEPYRQAPSWADWFAKFGGRPVDGARGLHINDYALVLQAVLEGQGIALGWRHLTERLVDAGLLQRVTASALVTGRAYFVVWPKDRQLSAPAALVRDWLASQSEAPPSAREKA